MSSHAADARRTFANSYATRAQRHSPGGGLDDFPTPLWAVRALISDVLPQLGVSAPLGHVLDPACGRGGLVLALAEYCRLVEGADVHDYTGAFARRCFLTGPPAPADWFITNPPFCQWQAFAQRALALAKQGVALLGRIQLLESQRRERDLWMPHPPAAVAVFSGRLPICAGRLDPAGTSATAYAWFVWLKRRPAPVQDGIRLILIPFDSRRRHDRPGDWVGGHAGG